MLSRTALFAVLATVDVIGVTTATTAAPDAHRILSTAGDPPAVQLAGYNKSRSRSLKLSATQSGGPCGVWQCTWPTGNGGCLVWEKTKCKVINPFD